MLTVMQSYGYMRGNEVSRNGEIVDKYRVEVKQIITFEEEKWAWSVYYIIGESTLFRIAGGASLTKHQACAEANNYVVNIKKKRQLENKYESEKIVYEL